MRLAFVSLDSFWWLAHECSSTLWRACIILKTSCGAFKREKSTVGIWGFGAFVLRFSFASRSLFRKFGLAACLWWLCSVSLVYGFCSFKQAESPSPISLKVFTFVSTLLRAATCLSVLFHLGLLRRAVSINVATSSVCATYLSGFKKNRFPLERAVHKRGRKG